MNKRSTLLLAASVVGFNIVTSVAVAQRQGAAELSLSRGIDAVVAEDYTAARRQFEAALALEPDFAAAHYFLGLTLLQTASQIPDRGPREAVLERAMAEFEQARLRDPQMVLTYLDTAIAGTILGRFDQAESDFQKFLDERPNDPLPHLFLAVLHYRMSQEDPAHLAQAEESLNAAENALQAAGRVDRTLQAHISFYRGLVALEREDRESARTALRESYELDPDSDVGLQSKEILDMIVDRRPWDLTLRLGFDYDTNVTLKGRNIKRRFGEDDGDDWRFGVGSDFSYRIIDTEEFLFGVGTYTYNSWHTDISDFNVQTYGANIFAAYAPPGADYLTLSMRYDWDHTLVRNQSYLSRHRVTAQIDIRETDWTSTTLFYQYVANNYYNLGANSLTARDSGPKFDRDGDTNAFGIMQRFTLGEMFDRPLTADLSYRFENVATDGDEFDSDNHVFAVGVGIPLPDHFTIDFIGEVEIQYYDNRSAFDSDSSRRRDFISTAIVALTKEFNENLSARLQVEITEGDSNVRDRFGQEFFSYDRIVCGLSLSYRF
jgi:tetratricopeptide (TPR) repeat protein